MATILNRIEDDYMEKLDLLLKFEAGISRKELGIELRVLLHEAIEQAWAAGHECEQPGERWVYNIQCACGYLRTGYKTVRTASRFALEHHRRPGKHQVEITKLSILKEQKV